MFQTSMRSHTCNDLSTKEFNKKVSLCGWVNTRRDHGGIIFIDLRDRYGLTQIVFDPEFNKGIHKSAEFLRREDCIQIIGIVKKRKKGMENKKLKTGEVEVFVDKLHVFAKSEVPPIGIDSDEVASEETRLKYRYLDLRRSTMQKNLLFRQQVMNAAREYFNEQGFVEIETPMLVKPTPEGARDYIVPSRVNPGQFYALPQSPQLYKQILMVAGFDRYFQFARCLRDEDLRADRQPEHTQIDIEISFVNQQDILDIVEEMYKYVIKKTLDKKLEKFPVFTYAEAKDKYGNDKPDLRFDLKLFDVTEIAKKSNFSVFNEIIKNNGIIKCINPEREFTRGEIEEYTKFCVSFGAKGLAYMKYENGKLESNISKYFSSDALKELIRITKIKKGYLFFVADKEKTVNNVLSELRLKLGKDLNLVKDELKFCWIVDFPLFSYNEDEQKWEPEHHMFTMPKEEHLGFLESEPGKVLGNLFDLVLNGTEIGSGSIRITRPDIQERIMKFIGINKEEAERKFGFLLNAYNFAGPVHGGMGMGFDRTVALLLGGNDIREVIAFPKNKNAQCPMDGSPAEVDEKQLKEAHIKTDVAMKKHK
ncbi:aspartate--tRNA ligase [Candidatus Woesearchaeota archaeon]|nr:aspartate--tRNA ligase [Candidatus Woesearchaeota archaeon]